MPRTGGGLPVSLSVPPSVRSQLQKEGFPLRWEAGSLWGRTGKQGWPGRPQSAQDPCSPMLGAARGSRKARPVPGLLAVCTGVWSVVGDLYCEKVRTLSTNWNLKFQRGKTEGPTPHGDGSWLLSPMTFVLCLDKSQVPQHRSLGGVVSTQGK